MESGNLFCNIPEAGSEEIIEALVETGAVRIERIVSQAHASPEGFWYDQERNEWVMVLEGSAGLRFEGHSEVQILKAGDWVTIAAHTRHRVEWTDARTIWLAVFY